MSSVTLLLGSGVSLSAGMPSTQDITRLVVSGEGAWRHTDERYILTGDPNHSLEPESVPLVLSFLSSLAKLAEQYYGPTFSAHANYEELFYLARQVADCETREYDNPAVLPLCRRLRRELNPRLGVAGTFGRGYWSLARLADETCSYIADVALHLLCARPKTTEYIAPLVRTFCQTASGSGTIATLNHDTVIESALCAIEVPYDDGFVALTPEMARLEPARLAAGSVLRVLKLHGSLDWHWVQERDCDTPREFRVRISPGADHSKLLLPDGSRFRVTSTRPLILIGTHNKILDYSGEVFLRLFYRFSEALQKSSSLVVCGYGFGDKGINRTVLEWLESESSRRMTIIHPDPDALCREAREAISSRWDSWRERHKLRLVPRKLEELTASDLEKVFSPDL